MYWPLVTKDTRTSCDRKNFFFFMFSAHCAHDAVNDENTDLLLLLRDWDFCLVRATHQRPKIELKIKFPLKKNCSLRLQFNFWDDIFFAMHQQSVSCIAVGYYDMHMHIYMSLFIFNAVDVPRTMTWSTKCMRAINFKHPLVHFVLLLHIFFFLGGCLVAISFIYKSKIENSPFHAK